MGGFRLDRTFLFQQVLCLHLLFNLYGSVLLQLLHTALQPLHASLVQLHGVLVVGLQLVLFLLRMASFLLQLLRQSLYDVGVAVVYPIQLSRIGQMQVGTTSLLLVLVQTVR